MKPCRIVALVFLLIMLMVTQKLMAVYPLAHTYSISPDWLHQIRTAAGTIPGTPPSDGLINQYWEGYTRSFRDQNPDPGDQQIDRVFSNSFGFENRAIRTYTAVVGYFEDSEIYSAELDSIRTYLYDFPWEIYQNALKTKNFYTSENHPEMTSYNWKQSWWNLDDYQRAREMSYNLLFMSYIADMLYYAYADTTLDEYTQVHDPVNGILKNLQDHVKWIHESFFNYGTPNSPADGWNNIGWNINDLYAPNDENRSVSLLRANPYTCR